MIRRVEPSEADKWQEIQNDMSEWMGMALVLTDLAHCAIEDAEQMSEEQIRETFNTIQTIVRNKTSPGQHAGYAMKYFLLETARYVINTLEGAD